MSFADLQEPKPGVAGYRLANQKKGHPSQDGIEWAQDDVSIKDLCDCWTYAYLQLLVQVQVQVGLKKRGPVNSRAVLQPFLYQCQSLKRGTSKVCYKTTCPLYPGVRSVRVPSRHETFLRNDISVQAWRSDRTQDRLDHISFFHPCRLRRPVDVKVIACCDRDPS